MKKQLTIDAIIAITVFIFLYAALSKLLDYNVFKAQLGRSPMTSEYAGILAWFVPLLEFIASILLAVPRTRVIGLHISYILMYSFTAYIAIMLMFSPSLPCSCGGILSRMEWHHHLVFNMVVTALIGIATIMQAISKLELAEMGGFVGHRVSN